MSLLSKQQWIVHSRITQPYLALNDETTNMISCMYSNLAESRFP